MQARGHHKQRSTRRESNTGSSASVATLDRAEPVVLTRQIVTHWPDGQAEPRTIGYTAADLLAAALVVAGVPSRFVAARFETFDPRPGTETALAACQRFPAGEDGDLCSLVLTGPPGTGKTHLAVSTLAERARKHAGRDPEHRLFRSRFATVPRLLHAMRRHVRGDDPHDPLDALLDAPLLVLDDLGSESSSGWTIDRLTTLVGVRYDDQLATVVTSNHTLDELADRGYDRIISRLCEDGLRVRIEASDYRLERRL